MRGLLLLCVLTIVSCVHYASAQWPKWVLTKGVICEERCKKIKNCDPLNEFSACKCFPRQYVKKWLQYNTLPMEPHLVCLMSVAGVVPKCCDIYKKEKDSYKNCASEIEDANEELKKSHDAEMGEMTTKLGSCEQDGGHSTSNMTAEMLVLILEQNRNQNQEMEELKKRFEEKSEQLEKRLATEEEQNSNQSQVIDQLEKRLEEERDDRQRQNSNQSQEIENLTQAWSSEPWKPFATELVKSVGAPSSIGFYAYLKKATVEEEEIVKFDQVDTNTGGGYNPSTGIFTCPEDGTYQFTVAALALIYEGSFIRGYIISVKDNSYYIFYMKAKVTTYYWVEKTVLLRLRKGDDVMVEIYRLYMNKLDNGSGRYTSFSGFLAYK